MTTPGRYASSDGSFAKSAGNAAARGGVLIAIAVVIGIALLAWGFDGGGVDATVAPSGDSGDSAAPAGDSGDTSADSGDAAADSGDAAGDSGDTAAGDNQDTTSTTQPLDDTVAADPPSTVQVAVLNGSGEPGLAGSRGEALGAVGYKWTPGNAASFEIADSVVYYTPGYAEEAKLVAEALSGGPNVLAPAPDDVTTLTNEAGADDVAAANVIVVLGTDGQLR